MALLRNCRSSVKRASGQAMVEFALTMPILLFFILGLIDFSVILFSYSQESNALRNALRYSQLIGYSSDTIPYLNCPKLIDLASDTYFVADHDVTIRYRNTRTGALYTCSNVANSLLQNGDLLEMTVEITIEPLFLPLGDITMTFDGQRSIVKTIPVSYMDSNISDDAPYAPYPFDAQVNCAVEDGVPNVSFYWRNMDPKTTTLRVYDPDSRTLLRTINITSPTMDTCTDCAQIDPVNGYQCYFAQPYENSNYGPPTIVDCVYCNIRPDTPLNFTVQRNCGKGNVSFNWAWPVDADGAPVIPTRAEIRDANTDEVVVLYTEDMFVTECKNCDVIAVPGERSYYIVSVNRAGPSEISSNPSAVVTAECPPDVAVIHGYLRTANDSLCSGYHGGFAGQTVLIRRTDMDMVFAVVTDETGYFYIENVPVGTYSIQPPLAIGLSALITRDDGATCGPASYPDVVITGGEVIEYTFGYQ